MPKKPLVAKRTPQRKPEPRHAVAARQLYVYHIRIQPDDGRYYVEVPALPGCYSWGYTYEEALQNAKQAIELWLEIKKEEGEPIPIEEPNAIRNAALTIGVLV